MSSRVLVALRVPGSPERAFRTFTQETALWWRPNTLFGFTPDAPGQVGFEAPSADRPGRFIEQGQNGRTFVIGEISVWDPPSRLVFAWRQSSFTGDQATEVDIRFEAIGEETRVTVEHLGWDSVPQAHVARHGFPAMVFAQRHGEWWRELLGRFKARLS